MAVVVERRKKMNKLRKFLITECNTLWEFMRINTPENVCFLSKIGDTDLMLEKRIGELL